MRKDTVENVCIVLSILLLIMLCSAMSGDPGQEQTTYEALFETPIMCSVFKTGC